MSDIVNASSGVLRTSRLEWGKIRRLARNLLIMVILVAATAVYMEGGPAAFMLNADGYVMRDHVAVAPAFEGRVAATYVRQGDHVEKGQKIALLESASLTRALAEVGVEKARLIGLIADLRGRAEVAAQTLPAAVASNNQTSAYLDELRKASAGGAVTGRALNEMAQASLTATERVVKMKAERDALGEQIAANESALAGIVATFNKLEAAYEDGVLYAPAAGDVGDEIAAPGQSLLVGESVAKIYSGENYILAYLPDSYSYELSEGDLVGVKSRRAILNARVDRVLPVYAALPREFQNPNRALDRGRLARVALLDRRDLPVGQKVQITTCLVDDCRAGMVDIVRAYASRALAGLNIDPAAVSRTADAAANSFRATTANAAFVVNGWAVASGHRAAEASAALSDKVKPRIAEELKLAATLAERARVSLSAFAHDIQTKLAEWERAASAPYGKNAAPYDGRHRSTPIAKHESSVVAAPPGATSSEVVNGCAATGCADRTVATRTKG